MTITIDHLISEYKLLVESIESQKETIDTICADIEYLKTYPPADDVALIAWTSLKTRHASAIATFKKSLVRLEELTILTTSNEAYQHYLKRNNSKPSLE